jgi:hypothetical protein
MPSRWIRGEINDSDSLSRVSPEAELTFFKLLLAVDDYGRMDARPEKLKGVLFSVRGAFTSKKIMGWIQELIGEGCVVAYRAGDRPYLYLPMWEKYRSNTKRAAKSRYPDPPVEPSPASWGSEDSPGILDSPGSPTDHTSSRIDVFTSSRIVSSPAASSKSPPKASTLADWTLRCSDLLIEYVRKAPGGVVGKNARIAWAKEILLLAKNTPTIADDPETHITGAIEWLFSPENTERGKYALVVRSGSALREKFPRIVSAALLGQRDKTMTEKARHDMDEYFRILDAAEGRDGAAAGRLEPGVQGSIGGQQALLPGESDPQGGVAEGPGHRDPEDC